MSIEIRNRYDFNTGMLTKRAFLIDSIKSTLSYKEAIELVYDLALVGKITDPTVLNKNAEANLLASIFRINNNFALIPGNNTGFNTKSRYALTNKGKPVDWSIFINNAMVDGEYGIFESAKNIIYTLTVFEKGKVASSEMDISSDSDKFDTINDFMVALTKSNEDVYNALLDKFEYLHNIYNVIMTDLVPNAKILLTNYKLDKYENGTISKLSWGNNHTK